MTEDDYVKTTRRGFMGSILALGMTPAVVRAQSLMHVRPLVDASYPIYHYGKGIVSLYSGQYPDKSRLIAQFPVHDFTITAAAPLSDLPYMDVRTAEILIPGIHLPWTHGGYT